MNFNQLKYLIAIDKHRNFSRAAEECNIAQSTLSKEIQRLEKEFDIIIFDRSRFPVTPTLKGIDLIEQAKNILTEYNKFIETARQKQNKPKGNFKLAVLPTLAPYLLPLFIQTLGKKYPELNVEILELTQKEMWEQFEDEKLDAAIAISPFIKDGFYEDFLFREDFVLYIGTQHELSTTKEIQWKDIPLNELLLHEAFKRYVLSSEELKEVVEKNKNKLDNINYQNGSLETLRKIIDRNGGLTILPQLSTLYMGERRLKMVHQIINPTLSRSVTFVTPRGFEKNRVTKAIKKVIKASLPSNINRF